MMLRPSKRRASWRETFHKTEILPRRSGSWSLMTKATSFMRSRCFGCDGWKASAWCKRLVNVVKCQSIAECGSLIFRHGDLPAPKSLSRLPHRDGMRAD